CTEAGAGMVGRLLQRLHDGGLPFIKVENLYDFDGERGYSLAQGQ
ncbi:MAG: hypothetical protein IBJ17_13510, partial [Reyranella sp.]|nr:hypothetical protein [Reyranella sp.]